MIFLLVIIIAIIISSFLGVYAGGALFNFTTGEAMRIVTNCFLLIIALNAISCIIIELLPKKIFNPFGKLGKSFKWERKFYEKIGIRKWKDKIPEVGKYFRFSKSVLIDKSDNEYILAFIRETICGEIIHFVGFLLGFIIIFVNIKSWFLIALPMIIANTIINIMPVMIQRYNRPKLLLLYQRNLKQKGTQNNKEN